MKHGNFILLSAVVVFASNVFAQDNTPKVELLGDYSYMQFNPSLTGLQSRAFNGGGGSVQFNINNFLAIKGDLQGYGSTSWTTTLSSPISTPSGVIPAGTYTSQGNMFTYLFGPVVGVHAKKFYLYGETLFGGSNSNGYANLTKEFAAGGATITAEGTQHPFTMAVGGGIDLVLTKNVALQLGEFDYILTRYTNPITQTNNQNSFRYLGGVVFRFGAR
jgi:hypothetical protein